jgi:hypothetical protein
MVGRLGHPQEPVMISSRTPEGDPNRCPVCGQDTRLEPSTVPIRDAPCPHCGCFLWFSRATGEPEHLKVNRLANEIVHLSERKLAPAEYYAEFLQRVLTAVAAPAGAVWLRTPHGNLHLQSLLNMHHVNLERNKNDRQMHDELLRQAAMKGQPGLIFPKSSIDTDERGGPIAGNPTDFVILLAPIIAEEKVVGLIEIFQRPNRGNESQRGFLQFLVKMAGHAATFSASVPAT